MAKNIQLSVEVYNRLESFRGKRETFSEAVDRLLTMLEKVGELRDILEGQIEYAKFRKDKLEEPAADIG